MKRLLSVVFTAAGLTGVMFLSACSGTQSSANLPATTKSTSSASFAFHSRLGSEIEQRHAAATKLYVTGFSTTSFFGYKTPNAHNAGPFCQSSSGYESVLGLATDHKGNLYMAYSPSGSATTSYIAEYGPNCGAQIGSSVLDPYGSFSFALKVYGKTWYVGNQYGPSFSPGNVAVCSASGCSSELTASAKSGGFGELLGLAVDHQGNVYADGYQGKGANAMLYEWDHGQMPGHVVKSFQGSTYVATGLQFDNNGNLAGITLAASMYQFVVWSGCPKSCTVNGPYALQSNTQAEFGVLNKDSTLFYVANYGTGSSGSIDVYAYHGTSGVTYKYSITNGLPTGVYAPSEIAAYP